MAVAFRDFFWRGGLIPLETWASQRRPSIGATTASGMVSKHGIGAATLHIYWCEHGPLRALVGSGVFRPSPHRVENGHFGHSWGHKRRKSTPMHCQQVEKTTSASEAESFVLASL